MPKNKTWFAVVIFMSLALSAPPVWAQNATAVGSLTVSSTFDTIWVKATYTGDANANNSFVLEYKPTGSGTWFNAYSPPPDRRSAVTGGVSNAANQNQFRAGVFGLTAGQIYDVRVTYSDADGVLGGPMLSATAALLSSATVVRSGGTFYLDDVGSNGDGSSGSPFNSFASAFAGTQCGDRLVVRPGTYAAFTFSKACSASTWYVIESETPLTASINDAPTRVVQINGNFVKMSGLKIPTATCSAFEISTGAHDVWLDANRIQDVGTTVVSIGHVAAYGCDGIRLNGNNYRVWATNNTILGPTLTAFGAATTHWDSCCDGIGVEGTPSLIGTFVFSGNVITGTFRDGIGVSNFGPTGGVDYSDVTRNVISGYADDGVEMDGSGINLLVGQNILISDNSFSCISHQYGLFGPMFDLRNVCRMTRAAGNAGVAWKVGGSQYLFVFHNSVETLGNVHDCLGDAAGVTTTQYITARNNIFKCYGNPVYKVYSTGTTFDYNEYSRISSTYIVSSWNGSANYSIDQFRSTAGQEAHGKSIDPLFSDTALHLQAGSPAIDAGVPLNNINTLNSAWPPMGPAPDMGAYEGPSNSSPPAAPINLQVR